MAYFRSNEPYPEEEYTEEAYPEEEEAEEEPKKDYRYMASWDHDPPILIRLGSFAKMEADMFVAPGEWKETPQLNDIRIGLGSYMDYDDISEKEAMKMMENLQEHYDRIAKRGVE